MKTIHELFTELQEANSRLKSAQHALAIARSEEAAAINECNRLQKLLDKEFSAMQNSAPQGTDWYSNCKVVKRPTDPSPSA